LGNPGTALDSVLEVLVETLDLSAASLYISTSDGEALCLRSQVGFPFEGYEDFELGLDSLPGRAIRERRTLVDRSPATSPLFRDKSLIERRPIAGMVAAPLQFKEKHPLESSATAELPVVVGAVCLFPAHHPDVEAVASWIDRYTYFLSRLYGVTVDRIAMNFRRKTVDRVAFKGDIGSLAHAFLNLVKEELSVEAASLWTVDTRRHLLSLRRSTDLASAERERDVPAIRVSEPGVISACFNSTDPVLHTTRNVVLRPDDVNEKLGRPLDNAALVPVPLPMHAKLRTKRIPSAGVLTLLNHFKRFNGVEHPTVFSWEDGFLAEFACEVISVLLYQMIRTQDHESDFERLIHGARTSLQAAKHNLQLLDERETVSTSQGDTTHLIPNAIDWLEDLESQINRDELVAAAELDLKSTALYGDVLAKLRPMVIRMRTRARNPTFSLTGLDDLSYSPRQLPRVTADRRALDCIFRNLIDNSMKYCRTDPHSPAIVNVEAAASDDGRTVNVVVSDNGIGIPNEERDLIFENGFRGRRASGRQPQGVGRGLFECRVLLERMGGEITLRDGEDGASFLVILKTAKNGRPS
jgi:hypothetical protein